MTSSRWWAIPTVFGVVLAAIVALITTPRSHAPAWEAPAERRVAPKEPTARSSLEIIAGLRASTSVWCSDGRRARALAYGEACVPWDSIPAINLPRFVDASGTELAPADPVVALELSGEHRAYPVAILSRHEIVNDEVAGRPVVVTYCPLCNSAVAFSRDVSGRTLTFGVSGQLVGANLVMFDRQTVSRWQQLTGQASSGPLEGAQLEQLAVRMVAFGAWAEAHPDGRVLEEPAGSSYPYDVDPYAAYDADPNQPSLVYDPPGIVGPSKPTDPRLPPKWRVIGVRNDDGAAAFPVPAGRGTTAVQTGRIGERPLVAFFRFGLAQPGKAYLLSEAPRGWAGEVFVARLGRRNLSFSPDGRRGFVEVGTGSRFDAFGRGVSGPLAGAELRSVPQVTAYWFSWSHFYPETRVAAGHRG